MPFDSISLLAIALSCLVCLGAFVYVGYPKLIIFASKRTRGRNPPQFKQNESREPSVVLFVSARNEERVLNKKIQNCLDLHYPAGLLEIFILSDGSTDKTNEIARAYQARGVKLISSATWNGKNSLIRIAMTQTSAELVVFTDANARLDRLAVSSLAKEMHSTNIGCVTGNVLHSSAPGHSNHAVVDYWNMETRTKLAESHFGCVIASNGALMACRRSLLPVLNDDMANDFQIPLHVLSLGKMSVFCETAVAYEEVVQDMLEERKRKVRIIIRGLTCVQKMGRKLRLKTLVHLFFRKICRWMMPPLAAVIWISLMGEALLSKRWSLLISTSLITAICALTVLAKSRKTNTSGKGRLQYLILIAQATCLAVIQFMLGRRVSTWKSPTTDRGLLEQDL